MLVRKYVGHLSPPQFTAIDGMERMQSLFPALIVKIKHLSPCHNGRSQAFANAEPPDRFQRVREAARNNGAG